MGRERLILFVDASFYRDERGPLAAAIAVVDGPGAILVDEVVEVETSTRAERRAMSAAFEIARAHPGPVEIRTDSESAHRMRSQAPPGDKVSLIPRSSNQRAHQVARRRARAQVKAVLDATGKQP